VPKPPVPWADVDEDRRGAALRKTGRVVMVRKFELAGG
jgi:hypothetical protein